METIETTKPATAFEPNEALKLAFGVTHGYVNRLVSKYRGGIHFEDSGLGRACCVMGWLTGLAQAGGRELANKLADEFVKKLDQLADYGGTTKVIRDGREIEVPSYVVCLGDDGTSHGFSLLWYGLVPNGLSSDDGKTRHFGVWHTPYRFAFNGGLIYHGPGGGENFSVSLSDCYWGIHT
jgi:hypothetical protein